MNPAVLFFIIAFFNTSTNFSGWGKSEKEVAEQVVTQYVSHVYSELDNKIEKPTLQVFEKALKGYIQLKAKHLIPDNNTTLTIIDYSLSSVQERLWVIDLATKKILYHTLVAHGKNSGEEFAQHFSNIPESFQSSMGFFLTGETYQGKHGLSLYLDGLENGFNDKARERAIVIHGADYVSNWFINKYGRLGRSLGCPALPNGKHDEIIRKIANKTLLFAFYPDNNYFKSSPLLNQEVDFSTIKAIGDSPEALLKYFQ